MQEDWKDILVIGRGRSSMQITLTKEQKKRRNKGRNGEREGRKEAEGRHLSISPQANPRTPLCFSG